MKKYIFFLYPLCLCLFILIGMGLERDLLFWQWNWSMSYVWRVWIAGGRFVIALAALGAAAGTLQLCMVRTRAAKAAVFFYLALSFAFIAFVVIQEDRMPATRDANVSIAGMSDMLVMGKTLFQFYPKQIALSAAAASAVAACLLMIGKRAAALPEKAVPPAWIAYVLYAASMFYFCAYPEKGHLIPVFIRTPVLFINCMKATNALYAGTRQTPPIDAANAPRFTSHILFVMDESVVGERMSLNGFRYDTTPYLRTLDDPGFHNYGIASSAANISHLSNLLVMSGLRPDQIPDRDQKSMHQASIFGFARHAGRRTYYVDAQNSRLQNFVYYRDQRDFELLRVFHSDFHFDREEASHRDRKGLAMIADALEKEERPAFVFLLKTGCHNPYDDKYPAETRYPELDGAPEAARTYLYSLRWGVNDFFREVRETFAGKDLIVVYTSDHGEQLRGIDVTGDSRYGKLAHGNMTNPNPIEANVPIFIWAMSDRAREEFEAAGGYRPDNMNGASHFQLFPTLLSLMGYEHDDVKSLYGRSLFDAPYPRRQFVSREFLDPDPPENVEWLNDFDLNR